jgi:hypothetical protein
MEAVLANQDVISSVRPNKGISTSTSWPRALATAPRRCRLLLAVVGCCAEH